MIVSPKGFAEPALVQAKGAGVGVFSLLPDDPIKAGFSIGVLWYARLCENSVFEKSIIIESICYGAGNAKIWGFHTA